MQNVERQRLFVAMALPEAVKDEIEKAQGELRGALPGECVRWTKRGQFHLTLRFLGSVEAGRVEDLRIVLSRACEGFPRLRLRAGRIGCFPDARFPRVIWVGVEDSGGQLAPLQSAVETASRDFTRERREGKFTGHVTLGRINEIKRPQPEALSTIVAGMTNRFFGEWTADRVELIRSELSAQGSRYTIVAAIPLLA